MRPLLLILLCFLLPCAGRADPLRVAVSIAPLKTFVDQVGGDHVEVRVMVEAGESPATYEPQPSQLVALSKTDLYFRMGLPFEKAWMKRMVSVGGASLTVVDLSQVSSDEDHACFAGDQHHHDPHVWVSPSRVARIVKIVRDQLAKKDPAHAERYQENAARQLEEISTLESYLFDALEGYQGRAFMVFHPSWQYFADDYNLEMIPIEVGGQEPSPRELADSIKLGREKKVRTVVVQPEFSSIAAQTVAKQLEARLVEISPLAENWAENLRRLAGHLVEGWNQVGE